MVNNPLIRPNFLGWEWHWGEVPLDCHNCFSSKNLHPPKNDWFTLGKSHVSLAFWKATKKETTTIPSEGATAALPEPLEKRYQFWLQQIQPTSTYNWNLPKTTQLLYHYLKLAQDNYSRHTKTFLESCKLCPCSYPYKNCVSKEFPNTKSSHGRQIIMLQFYMSIYKHQPYL